MSVVSEIVVQHTHFIVDRAENWTENWTELNWTELNWTELNWTEHEVLYYAEIIYYVVFVARMASLWLLPVVGGESGG